MMTVSSPPIENVSFGQAVAVAFSAVVTLYNEEKNVEPLTRNLVAEFRRDFGEGGFELVLVLNGPLDRTPQLARQLALEFPEITLVSMAANQGYGGGLLAGLSVARGPVVGVLDGDEQVDSRDVARVFQSALSEPCDLVKACRTVRQDGWRRIVVTTVYNALFRLLFGAVSTDVNGKPKVLRREALQRLDPTARDWFIDAEIMIRASRLGFSVREIPVAFRARRAGASNVRVSTILEFLGNMWKFRHGRS